MSLHIRQPKPLYLASYTVAKRICQCDLCPATFPVADVALMDAHLERVHINGGRK